MSENSRPNDERIGVSLRVCAVTIKQCGLTLVELLITMVVVSVGLLGMATLHLVSLRNNVHAHLRSQASVLAADIADRMRTHAAVARDSGYTVSVDGSLPADPQAAMDIAAWRSSLSQLLPAGEGSISPTTTIGLDKVVTINVRWLERLTISSGAGDTTPVMNFQITAAI